MGQSIVLTISGNCSRLEEGEAVLAFEGRHPARGKLGKEFGRPVRGIVDVVAGLVDGETSKRNNRFDLKRSGARVSTDDPSGKDGRRGDRHTRRDFPCCGEARYRVPIDILAVGSEWGD